MKVYYVLEIDTSMKDTQLDRLHQTVARECHLQFGKKARVWHSKLPSTKFSGDLITYRGDAL